MADIPRGCGRGVGFIGGKSGARPFAASAAMLELTDQISLVSHRTDNKILTLTVELAYDGVYEGILGGNMAPSNGHFVVKILHRRQLVNLFHIPIVRAQAYRASNFNMAVPLHSLRLVSILIP